VTPLGRMLAAEIREQGPIGVDRFMAGALGDPQHGYYMTRDPLGIEGDFITSPEISQIFGEIIGLWFAEHWQAMGAPEPVHLIELGPGRGTLMADLLRALRVLPACRAAVTVHLVETSPVLAEAQRRTLACFHPDIIPRWHATLGTVPDGPTLLVANEFFDALPIRQWLRHDGKWHERRVALDPDGSFIFVCGEIGFPTPEPPGEIPDGAILETADPASEIATMIGDRLRRAAGAALLIDYGHPETATGETLQAVKAHRPVPVLNEPGEADITAHVDFAALAGALRAGGAVTGALQTQGKFLIENGAELRAERLCRQASPEQAISIRRGLQRLIDPTGMGRLFKILPVTSPPSAPTC